MTPEQTTELNKAVTEGIAKHLKLTIEGLMELSERCHGCDSVHGSNGISNDSVFPNLEPCPHCADNRAEAARLSKIAEGLVVHEICKTCDDEEYVYDKTPCRTDNGSLEPIGSMLCPDCDNIANPDYTTYEGMGKLIGLIRDIKILDAFFDWLDDNYYKIHTSKDEILTTPELFAQAVDSFLGRG